MEPENHFDRRQAEELHHPPRLFLKVVDDRLLCDAGSVRRNARRGGIFTYKGETLDVDAVQIGCSFMSLTVRVQNQIDEPHSSNRLNTHPGKNRAGISGRQSRLGGARIQFPPDLRRHLLDAL